jgi:mRNA interferase MazF
MAKGKVVLVPFPFDDLTGTKVRPAVCLTNTIGEHRHVVLAFITSQDPPNFLPSDIVFDPASADFSTTGLRRRSVLRLHRLLTVGDTMIARQLGTLSANQQQQVENALRIVFGL